MIRLNIKGGRFTVAGDGYKRSLLTLYSMTKFLLTTICLLSLLPTAFTQCYDDWQFTRTLTITNPSATEMLKAGPASFPILTDSLVQTGKLRTDGLDLRITDDQCMDVPFFVDSAFTASTNFIWVNLPDIAAGNSITLNLYYGRPDADSMVMNGDQVFTFADGFYGTALDTSKWEFFGEYATADVADGILAYSSTRDVNSGSRFKFMRSKMAFSDSMWLDFSIYQSNSAHFGYSSTDTAIERYLMRYPGKDTMRQIAIMTDTFSNGYATVNVWPDVVVPWRTWSNLRMKLWITPDNKLEVMEFHNLTNGSSQDSSKIFEPLEMSGWHFILSTFAQTSEVEVDHVRMWPAIGDNVMATTQAGDEVDRMMPSDAIDRMVRTLPVYPNPTTGILHLPAIRYNRGELLDIMGRPIMIWETQSTKIQLDDVPTGMYLVKLWQGEELLGIARVVKE